MAAVFLFAFNFTVFLPLLAVRDLGGGAGTFGLLLGNLRGGIARGSLFMAARAAQPNRAVCACWRWRWAASRWRSRSLRRCRSALVIIAPLGFAGIAFAITGNSTLQLTSAPDRRGRVMSLYTVVFLGSTPIGGPLAGWVGEHLGARVGIAAGERSPSRRACSRSAALTGARPLSRARPGPMIPAPVIEDHTA